MSHSGQSKQSLDPSQTGQQAPRASTETSGRSTAGASRKRTAEDADLWPNGEYFSDEEMNAECGIRVICLKPSTHGTQTTELDESQSAVGTPANAEHGVPSGSAGSVVGGFEKTNTQPAGMSQVSTPGQTANMKSSDEAKEAVDVGDAA